MSLSLLAAYSDSENEEEAPESDKETSIQETGSMFGSLPAPKKETIIIQAEDEVVPIKKQKVQISIPSLSDFKDEDNYIPKKKIQQAPFGKGSGLLSILPEPKNSLKMIVPQVVKKQGNKAKSVPLVPRTVATKKSVSTNVKSKDDSDDDTDNNSDFFSLTNQSVPEAAEINLDDLLPKVAGPSKLPPRMHQTTTEKSEIQYTEQTESIYEEETPVELDEQAMIRLCGRKNAKEEQQQQCNMIELRGDDMLPDKNDWMVKALTEEKPDLSHRANQPDSNQRRKHQITYLAYQAKEREVELKNQWADNRMSRKQTQSKYGF